VLLPVGIVTVVFSLEVVLLVVVVDVPSLGCVGGHRVGKVLRVVDKVDKVEPVVVIGEVVDDDPVVVIVEVDEVDSVVVIFEEVVEVDSAVVVFEELDEVVSAVVSEEVDEVDSVNVVFGEVVEVDSTVVISSSQVAVTLPVTVLLHANGNSPLQASIHCDPSHDEASAEPSGIGGQPGPSQQKQEHIALPFVVDTYRVANMPTSRIIYFLNILDFLLFPKTSREN